ncbi:cyclin-SDS-like [Cucumis sativus]|uniref:cyclin-SDS-like n=1 Tax=Cucumis sativus TaxID=3659 RepID=UPI0002B43DAB|nr:cyclin-SDS-like [Cucumis sativus]KGN50819.2 hypothetical protein Csa_018489 [Cucumis sativus]
MKSKKRRPNPKPQSFSPPKNKKLRSQLPRRKRPLILPFFCCYLDSDSPPPSTTFSFASSSSFTAAQSTSTSFFPTGPEVSSHLNPLNFRKTRFDSNKEVGVGSNEQVSESSCVESNSGLDFGVSGPSTTSKLKNRRTIHGNEDPIDPAENGVDASSKLCGKGAVVLTSCVESCAESIFQSVCSFEEKGLEVEDNRLWEFQLPELQKNEINKTFTVSKSDSTIEQWPGSLKIESDLACTEQFSYDDVSEYLSQPLSLQSTILLEMSDDCSDYTPSIFLESGSEFSEKSNEDAAPTSTFTMLLQYRREFISLNFSHIRTSSSIEEEEVDQSTILRFEELDDEEAYRMFRNRERRQLIICDYIEEYRSTTDYGDFILQQRSNMVQWIVERSREKKLHQETTFLGVTLLDQILSKGFFKAETHLQILGIACLTLATRIEENQSYSWLQQRNIHVGSNTYRRSKVVGMEWLVEEVLKFHCFLPTVYNFLWFYLKAAGANSDLENRAKNFAVLVLAEKVQFCYFPSTIAAAVVILASLGEKQDAPSERVIEIHVRTENDDLPECIESLEWLLKFL